METIGNLKDLDPKPSLAPQETSACCDVLRRLLGASAAELLQRWASRHQDVTSDREGSKITETGSKPPPLDRRRTAHFDM